MLGNFYFETLKIVPGRSIIHYSLTVCSYPTTSPQMILDTFHFPEAVQDRFFFSNPTTITRSSKHPQ